MSYNNTTVLIGRLTRDPELRFTHSGIAICKFGMAVSEKRGETEKVAFFDITCWRGVAEEAGASLSKGSPVVIVGNLELEQWDDKTTGQKRSKVGVTAHTVATPLYRAKDTQRAPKPKPEESTPALDKMDDGEGVPF